MAGLFFARRKKHNLLLVCCLSATSLVAQFRVGVRLNTDTSKHVNDTIYIAGDFNNWNPHDTNYQIIKSDDRYSFEIKDAAAGAYQFKLTRGDWSKVETNPDGSAMENRKLLLDTDTILYMTVAAWSDDFPGLPKQHTASSHVSVMDTAFPMPGLNRTRKIWLYLPDGYSSSKKRYPVLYMHDGQNLFDKYTAAFGEWGVDEWMDSLVASGKPPCIVVGIENGPGRMNEYNPFYNEKFGEGEGQQYTDFLVASLKPYIDEHYRTLPAKENTIIAGSSMGGLISYYAMLKYPDVFGKAGIFSPAFWTCPAIGAFTDSTASQVTGKFFFYAGGEEGEAFVEDMRLVQEKLGKNSKAMLYSVVDSTGSHNEAAWRKWFGEFYCWIMAAGFNVVSKVNY